MTGRPTTVKEKIAGFEMLGASMVAMVGICNVADRMVARGEASNMADAFTLLIAELTVASKRIRAIAGTDD